MSQDIRVSVDDPPYIHWNILTSRDKDRGDPREFMGHT